MKFAFGVASVVIGYALVYQGAFMARVYRPATGDFLVGIPPLSALLGFAKPQASMQAPFSWEAK